MGARYSLRLGLGFPILVFCLGLVLFSGCTPAPTKTELNQGEKEIMRLASLYNSYRSSHGKGPKDAAELKSWVKKMKKEELEKYGISDVDAAFISPRDQQPYAVIPAQPSPGKGGGPPPMVWVYEQTGVNGRRMVAGATGNAREMEEAELKRFTGGK